MFVRDFQSWRAAARDFIASGLHPDCVSFQDEAGGQPALFKEPPAAPSGPRKLTIPARFLKVAAMAAMHSSPERWNLLYRVAWRLIHEARSLLEIEIDSDVRALLRLCRAVKADMYHMRQFVRFRRVEGDQYVAWYRPEHDTLLANAPFFRDRFGSMRWAILTPSRSIHWDLFALRQGPGVPRSAAPAEDELEELWRVYYSAVFNPARLNLGAMRAQLPVRNWVDLPEARVIRDLVQGSRLNVQNMAGSRHPAANVPAGATMELLRARIPECNACGICRRATGPVLGKGPYPARIMLVGEQPGDEEDRAGLPFIGPAGQVLDEILAAAGLDRTQLYVTNAVKAFRFEERGKRRIHQRPRGSEISACRPWLRAEIEIVRPGVLVCLGATAAQSVVGRAVSIGEERSRNIPTPLGPAVVTYHPSAALRTSDPGESLRIRKCIREDLAFAQKLLAVPPRTGKAAFSSAIGACSDPTRPRETGPVPPMQYNS